MLEFRRIYGILANNIVLKFTLERFEIMNIKKMVGYALFAALTAVFSQIAIPLPGLVPINLATLSVFIAGGPVGRIGGGG